MVKLLCLIFFASLLNNISCNGKPKDEYEERVQQVITYLNNEQNFQFRDCANVYLLQLSKFNVCTDETLQRICTEKLDNEEYIFILSNYNEEISKYIKMHFSSSTIFFDNEKLPRYGLSFLRNLNARICNKKVIEYTFFQ